ncbi:MAG: MotA/TolQ/ExbB proton channel family protein [Planctomycetota bacterium]|jgi:biopolymer transport protein ExbB
MTVPWSLPLLGQIDGAQGADAGTMSAAQIESVWDFALKGGPMMIPIGICSLVVLAVIIERLVSLRRRNVIPGGFLPELRAMLDEEPEDRTAAIEYCQNDASPVAGILAVGVKRLHEPIELLEKHIHEAGERAVFKLRKYLRLLFVIASIAPLLGLLGTIFGMITAFQTVAMSGEALGKAELLAKGIYEAMITTAAGLLVAIPALIGHHWISAKIEHLVAEIDLMTCEYVEEYAQAESTRVDAEPKLHAIEDSKDSDGQTSREPTAAIASA